MPNSTCTPALHTDLEFTTSGAGTLIVTASTVLFLDHYIYTETQYTIAIELTNQTSCVDFPGGSVY